MESTSRIEQFLDRVRRQRIRLHGLNGVCLLLILLCAGFLVVSSAAYVHPRFREYLPLFALVWALPLAWVVFRHFIRGVFAPFSLEDTALLVEDRIVGLENGLINSMQLKPLLEHPPSRQGPISGAFIQKLLDRTGERVGTLNPETILTRTDLIRNRNILGAFLGGLLVLFLLWPNLFSQGLRNLMAPPAEAKVSPETLRSGSETGAAAGGWDYQIDSLKLTFNYPTYTRLKQVVLDNSDGRIQVLPGTEIIVEARANRPVQNAELVLNGRDFLAMRVAEDGRMNGRFIAKEPGYYQFRVKPPQGDKTLLPARYPIELGRDQPPRIIIFLANPKPVYQASDKIQMYYETQDDFGINRIDLVFDTNGHTKRKTIKTVKSVETELKGDYTWELAMMRFEPGAEVQYHLEVFDNDNILGPNTGQSEMFSFEIFNEFKKRNDLLALQEELLDKMIRLLADSLVFHPETLTGSPQEMVELKRLLGGSTDQLIEIISLAQSILEQAKSIESFPQAYLTLLNNIVDGFNGIREEQIQVLTRLTTAIGKATPIGLNFPPIEPLNQKLVIHLERDILLLVKIINRERMDQVVDLQDNLQNLTEKLQEEFQNARNGKAGFDKPQFKKALEKIKETLQKIMEQLTRQVQGLSEEFLNPKAFENLNMENFNASMEKLMALINQGKMDEAMKQLEGLTEELEMLSNQLDQMLAEQENLIDLQTLKKLEESLAKIEHLEKEQKKLLDQTTGLNKQLRSKQSEHFESRLNEFFAALRKDVNQIQSLLREDGTFLEEHPGMKQLERLMDQESAITQDILDLNQKTIDALEAKDLQRRFSQLNEAREQLAEVTSRIQDLRLKMFHGFKTFLPQLKNMYDRLEEFTELQDLYEFDSLFKNTYPEVYRWENHFRTARDARADLQNRLTADLREVTRLNNEISKKLGTMRRDLQADYRALITPEDRQALDSMSQKQGGLRSQSDDVSQIFRRLTEQNPMIPPVLERKMSNTSRHMGHSQRGLKEQNIPDSIQAENRALNELGELKDMLKQMRENEGNQPQAMKRQRMVRLGSGRARDANQGGGSVRMQKERVNLPTEDQYQAPQQFREEILEAMKHRYPKQYERMVSEYYKELVK